MKKVFIILTLLFLVLLFAVLSSMTDIFGFAVNPYFTLGSAAGKITGGYLIAAFIVYLLNKLDSREQKRLLIVALLMLYGLLLKLGFIGSATRGCGEVMEAAVAEALSAGSEGSGEDFSSPLDL